MERKRNKTMTRTEKIKSKKAYEIRFINDFLEKMTLQELKYVYIFIALGYAKLKIEKEKKFDADRRLVKQGKLEWSKMRSRYIEF